MTVAPPSSAFLNRTVPDPWVAPNPVPVIVRTLPVPAVMEPGEKLVIAVVPSSFAVGWVVDGVVRGRISMYRPEGESTSYKSFFRS